MTLNERIKSVVDGIPEIKDYYYNDIGRVGGNGTIQWPALFRTLRTDDIYSEGRFFDYINTNETFLIGVLASSEPGGNYNDKIGLEEEAMEFECLNLMNEFLKGLKCAGFDFEISRELRWYRRDTYDYSLLLAFDIEMKDVISLCELEKRKC